MTGIKEEMYLSFLDSRVIAFFLTRNSFNRKIGKNFFEQPGVSICVWQGIVPMKMVKNVKQEGKSEEQDIETLRTKMSRGRKDLAQALKNNSQQRQMFQLKSWSDSSSKQQTRIRTSRLEVQSVDISFARGLLPESLEHSGRTHLASTLEGRQPRQTCCVVTCEGLFHFHESVWPHHKKRTFVSSFKRQLNNAGTVPQTKKFPEYTDCLNNVL